MDQLKSAIIGKMWKNNTTDLVPASHVLTSDVVFEANQAYLLGNLTFRTDRNLTTPVTVKKGERLFFYSNTKRAGFQDPDYSVSILLPVAEAEAVIAMTRAGAAAYKASQPVTVA